MEDMVAEEEDLGSAVGIWGDSGGGMYSVGEAKETMKAGSPGEWSAGKKRGQATLLGKKTELVRLLIQEPSLHICARKRGSEIHNLRKIQRDYLPRPQGLTAAGDAGARANVAFGPFIDGQCFFSGTGVPPVRKADSQGR